MNGSGFCFCFFGSACPHSQRAFALCAIAFVTESIASTRTAAQILAGFTLALPPPQKKQKPSDSEQSQQGASAATGPPELVNALPHLCNSGGSVLGFLWRSGLETTDYRICRCWYCSLCQPSTGLSGRSHSGYGRGLSPRSVADLCRQSCRHRR